MITVEKVTPRFELLMQIVTMGQDLTVILSGGDKPHLGAVALAVPHPGIRNRERCDASVSVLTVTGHKEDELARKIAYDLAVKFNCTVSASCGIHLENASKKEIHDVIESSCQMLQQAINQLQLEKIDRILSILLSTHIAK